MFISLYLLIILAVIILFFLSAFLFKPIGRLVQRIVGDFIKIINEDDKESED